MAELIYLSFKEFVATIAKDNNIDMWHTEILKLPSESHKIKSFTAGYAMKTTIWDGTKEHAYMEKPPIRNEQELNRGKELRRKRLKSLDDVLKELNLKLETCSVKVCEGNGWSSQAIRYFYKQFYTQ